MASERNDDPAVLERPLTARSVIASLLLGRHPPSAPPALLVRWCDLFGISDTAARVALTRMVQHGELSAEDGVYELAGRVRARQSEQDFALAPHLGPWDGTWKIAIVPGGSRPASERVELRRTMGHLRMASLRDGVWTRPDNLTHPEQLDAAAAACLWIRGARLAAADVVGIASRFDVHGYARRTATLAARLREVTTALPATNALAPAFVVGAAAAQHLRRDPLLPATLLPASWKADTLRDDYRTYERRFGAAVASWASA